VEGKIVGIDFYGPAKVYFGITNVSVENVSRSQKVVGTLSFVLTVKKSVPALTNSQLKFYLYTDKAVYYIGKISLNVVKE